MYVIKMVIKNVDENDKKYNLFEVDEDAHSGNYIEDIYTLFSERLTDVPKDAWRFECGGPLDSDHLDDECAFYLTTEQIKKIYERFSADRPLNWDKREQDHIEQMMQQLEKMCNPPDSN